MNKIETNIYLIENLEELNCKYRIYRVRGLSPSSDDYYKNLQFLATISSRKTNSPCLAYTTDQGTFIAQPDGYEELPDSLNLVRVIAKIERESELKEIRFDSLNPITAKLALRFLQGAIERKFYEMPSLWQPRAGHPFYHKFPDPDFRRLSKEVDLYRGFAFRVVLLPSGKIGVCVDVSRKYVSRFPLPARITREEFRKYQGLNCIYEYGNHWYEIKIEGLSDLNVSELSLPPQGTSLFDDIHSKAGSHKSQNLLTLPKDGSVLIYYTTSGEQRHAPSGLCRLIFGTNHPDVQQFHSKTIKPPHKRREEIRFVIDRYFRDLMFGFEKIRISKNPLVLDERVLIIPDLEFGNNKILSLKNTPNAINTTLDEFPYKKKELIYSNEAGLYIKKPFDNQYLILPKSIYQSFGEKFIEDIKREVQSFFLREGISYSPSIITYDDSVPKSVYRLGREIIKAVEENDINPGYGIVMIPEVRSRRMRKEDELANLVMRELRKRKIYVSVIHSTVPSESYTENENGEWELTSDNKQRTTYKGYLRNVVLNKILILNSFWPFVLKTPLNADLIIGIDVKNNTAGFTLINKNGSEITFHWSESDQKEQLSRNQVRTEIIRLIKREQELSFKDIAHIVIHRQGKLFPQEKEGILQALDALKREEIINRNTQCTFVEIRGTSRVPLRLFKVTSLPGAQKEWVDNPTIGTHTYDVLGDEAFICTTGPPYEHKGTTKPLHVVKDGPLSIESVLEDVFYLSNLTFTKIDDCSRQPLSIKITDIRLREFAGEYDLDALRFGEE
jgi:hypothetical protein